MLLLLLLLLLLMMIDVAAQDTACVVPPRRAFGPVSVGSNHCAGAWHHPGTTWATAVTVIPQAQQQNMPRW
jgi:hypothetical protein